MASIDIYIGAHIEYDSERKAILHIFSLLQQKNVDAVIIANVNLQTTQIDLIVAFDQKCFAIEVKGSEWPVEGSINGPWKIKSPAGAAKPVSNYYQQALKAKNTLRDAIASFTGATAGYPEAILLFVPGLAPGSIVPQPDFKVVIAELRSFDCMDDRPNGSLTIQQWRQFATHNKLQQVSSVQATFDKKLLEFEEKLFGYRKQLRALYESDAHRLIPFDCSVDKQPMLVTGLLPFLAGRNLLLTGASGNGKSLAAKWLAVNAPQTYIPVFLESKNFEGSLAGLIDEELQIAGISSLKHLFETADKLQRQIIIFVDGFNECPPPFKGRLGRSLVAFHHRRLAEVMVISQGKEETFAGLKCVHAEMLQPSLEIRKKIALQYCTPDKLHALEPILLTATSGIEAALAGETATEPIQQIGRFALFNVYVDKKLGFMAQDCTSALASIARFLSHKISYNITLQETGKLWGQGQLGSDTLPALFRAGLLKKHMHTYSFSHELFLHFFTAVSIVQDAGGVAANIIQAMALPRHADKKAFIIGAVDDPLLLENILANVDDTGLLIAFFDGECGTFCKQWVKRKLRQLLQRMEAEIRGFAFQFTGEERITNILPAEGALVPWEIQEKSLVAALPVLAVEGHFIEELLRLTAIMDEVCLKEYQRLQPEAKKKSQTINSNLFMTAYVPNFTNGTALSMVFSRLRDGTAKRDWHQDYSADLHTGLFKQYVASHTLTRGQLFFMVLFWRFNLDKKFLFGLIYNAISHQWASLPYHLRIELLEHAVLSCSTEEEEMPMRDALSALPQSYNVFISSSITESLAALGAFEHDAEGYTDNISEDIQRLLLEDDEAAWKKAAQLFDCQFDHPYDASYYAAIHRLDDNERKRFLIMAVKGSDVNIFTSALLSMLGPLLDAASCVCFEKWRNVPQLKHSHYPQDEITVFMYVHILMGAYAYQITIPIDTAEDTPDSAMYACAGIYYWLNRKDISMALRKERCNHYLQYLMQPGCTTAVDAVYQARWTMRDMRLREAFPNGDVWFMDGVFKEEVADICRYGLQRPDKLVDLMSFGPHNSAARHAIWMLKHTGGLIDIPLLKKFADDPVLGEAAIQACLKIESAVVS